MSDICVSMQRSGSIGYDHTIWVALVAQCLVRDHTTGLLQAAHGKASLSMPHFIIGKLSEDKLTSLVGLSAIWEQKQQVLSRRLRMLQMAAWTPSNSLSRLEVDTWGSWCAFSCGSGSMEMVLYMIKAIVGNLSVCLSCCCRSLWDSTPSHLPNWTASISCTLSCGGVAQHLLW